jgi:hypothetical protein
MNAHWLKVFPFFVTASIASTACSQFATVINVPPDIAPSSIGSNTQLNLFDGGSISTFFDAGTPGGDSTNIEVNIVGGSVGDFFDANRGSTVNVSGGSVATAFDANSGSTVNISGGTIGGGFDANPGSTVNISGGAIGDQFSAASDSTITISGGSFVGRFNAFAASNVNVTGTEFFLDGVEITGLIAGQPRTVTERGVTLSGLLANIMPFSFDLNGAPVFGEDLFSADAMLTVTLVQQTLIGDYNSNGTVDAADYVVWRETLGEVGSGLAADGNGNNQIEGGDYTVWRARFAQASSKGSFANFTVCEPATIAMLIATMLATIASRQASPRFN